LNAKQNAVGHAAIGFELLPGFFSNTGSVKRNKVTGFLCGKDSKGRPGLQIHKGGSHDPVVHELQGPAPELDSGDMSDGICSAAIQFNVDKNPLDLTVLSRILQPDETAPEHGHSHPDRLSGTQVAMSFSRGCKEFFKVLHF
jgi:hypothetical protein